MCGPKIAISIGEVKFASLFAGDPARAGRLDKPASLAKKDFFLLRVGGQDFLVPRGPKVKDLNALATLNATGRCVWELLAEDRSAEDLAAAVAKRSRVAGSSRKSPRIRPLSNAMRRGRYF